MQRLMFGYKHQVVGGTACEFCLLNSRRWQTYIHTNGLTCWKPANRIEPSEVKQFWPDMCEL